VVSVGRARPRGGRVPDLAALLDSRRPDVIGLVGIAGLVILLWLMYFKPV